MVSEIVLVISRELTRISVGKNAYTSMLGEEGS